jgi:hypothetical protein
MSKLEKDFRRETVHAAVLRVQTTVEGVLQSASLTTLVGLSTNPDLVDQTITPETLRGKCGTICEDLQDRLKTAGVLVDMCISGDRNTSWHRYLGTRHDGVEVIIDPSIGQFIKGHRQVFIGTRDQLKQLVLHPKTVIVNARTSIPHEVFSRTWGSISQVV